MKIQPMPKPTATRSAKAAMTPDDPRFRAIAEDQADRQDDRCGDQMAQNVANHQSGEGRERPDRQRAETVEQTFAEIGR